MYYFLLTILRKDYPKPNVSDHHIIIFFLLVHPKPENVLLSERGGHVILIDFGTAKDLIATDLNGPEFVGTPDFMSPEAVKELKGGDGCDFTADLWSLGVVLYQLYAGALPFESQRYALVSQMSIVNGLIFPA